MNDYINDYISRKAALNAIYTSTAPALEVKAMPAADVVEVRHGRWILNDDESVAYCSECDCAIPMKWGKDMTWLYCPECGLKMDGGQNK